MVISVMEITILPLMAMERKRNRPQFCRRELPRSAPESFRFLVLPKVPNRPFRESEIPKRLGIWVKKTAPGVATPETAIRAVRFDQPTALSS